MFGRPRVLELADEPVGHEHRQRARLALVEADGEALLLALRPQGIVGLVVPVAAADRVGADEHRLEVQLLLGTLGLGDGGRGRLDGQERRAVHAVGGMGAELGEPVVVGAGDGRCQVVVVVLLGEGEQTAARVQHRHVHPLPVHGLDLHVGAPAASVVVPVERHAPVVLGHLLRLLALDLDIAVTHLRDQPTVVLEKQVHEELGRPHRCPVPVLGLHVLDPKVRRLAHVQIGIEDLEAVLRHGFPSPFASSGRGRERIQSTVTRPRNPEYSCAPRRRPPCASRPFGRAGEGGREAWRTTESRRPLHPYHGLTEY